MVFYEGNKIIGAPYAYDLIGNYNVNTIQNFINACPGNNFFCETF